MLGDKVYEQAVRERAAGDYAAAFSNFMISAKGGSRKSALALAQMYELGQGTSIETSQAYAWYGFVMENARPYESELSALGAEGRRKTGESLGVTLKASSDKVLDEIKSTNEPSRWMIGYHMWAGMNLAAFSQVLLRNAYSIDLGAIPSILTAMLGY